MIQWKNIKLILMRELRDQMRDRRTLFMVAILPLLLYPAMGIGMVQMTVLFSEQPRTVVMLGADELPKHPQLLDGDQFVSNWFTIPSDADKLRVITDSQPADTENLDSETTDTESDSDREEILKQARELELELKQHQNLLDEWDKLKDREDSSEAELLLNEITETKERLSKQFAESKIQVLIIIPKGLSKELERVSEQLARHEPIDFDPAVSSRPLVLENRADEKSKLAFIRVQEAMQAWEKAILRARLNRANLPVSLPTPINPEVIDLAQDDQLAANLWSKLFPALLIIMAATGAFYPAIDLGAGEKERGTMETLLISPAKRTEIVLGKFLTVLVFSVSTALLNLASMGFTGKHMVNVAGTGALSKIGDLSFPSFSALFWIVVLLIPLSGLFSALCLSLATFARSSKEGQYYLTPLLMVTIGLTVFCLSPAVEINPFYSLMPVVGVALLLKAMLLSTVNAGILYVYAIPVLVTSIGYSLLALWWAIDQFQREDVLFREAERFEVGLWLKHLMRTKDALPSFAEAGFCFVIIMLLQFAVMNTMRDAIQMATSAERPTRMMQLLMIQQLAIIATPALMMGIMLTTSMRKTFRLYLPRFGFWIVAIVLAFALHPLSQELVSSLRWFFPALPKGTVAVLQDMSDPNQAIWLILLAFALAPAVCEELAFRGFILSGFGRRGRAWLAIILSSVTFGAMHMIPQQVFNATLVGLALGLIAVHSRSLFPGIVFHFIYNSLSIYRGRVPEKWVPENGLQHFVSMGPEGLRYSWPLLLICAAVAIVLLRWVALQSQPAPGQPAESLSLSSYDRRLTDSN
ncbi:MAG: CPBP family intramembrane metalloprotease domain-containing protein [Gimesia sp.]|uniref:CPBP family intramembrane metalloprotease domain-containing protein n=1 Tax=Gimesia maris TaxID=122 RepID=A0A3D3R2E7_9PLAN|nr:CPBP family intramembrane metalloprotease domain-containing protein [Gimesia sp.]HCO22157.1 CPBP family intramembrane metalloprotease domain-containing protein [Gimesia maris]|tara:strand:- start:26455 stop:28884 length:2430 start_codon:yes stop_codon:yes gene_type:complete